MASSTIEMSQKLRVKIDPQFKNIYNSLKNKAVGDFHELFFLCTCLGFKNKTKKPLAKREDCFWSNTIIQDEWYAYYAMYLHDHGIDLSCLGDDVKVLDSMQQYANGGMEILIGEFLYDYVKKDSAGSYLVDCTEHLAKELLAKITMDWSS